MKLCFVNMPSARWCLQYFLTTCPNTFERWHLFHAMWCLLLQLLQTCAFQAIPQIHVWQGSLCMYAQHTILLIILLSSSFFYHWSKVYNKIFCAFSIHKHISITRQGMREEGGIPKMNHGLNNHHHQWLGACPYSTKTIVLYGQL
jgi:hypothetical protein